MSLSPRKRSAADIVTMKLSLTKPIIALLWAFIALSSAEGQESRKSVETASEAQLRLAGPGPEHEKLARYSGTWNVRVTMGPLTYHGAATNRMTVGGRFLQVEYQAEGEKGATEGIFIAGFDPRHQRHTLIAMDSFGPYFVTSQGKPDASGKLRLLGSDDDPTMKAMGFTKEFVHVVDFKSADEFTIEVRFIDTRTPERKEMKFMTYSFTRRTSP